MPLKFIVLLIIAITCFNTSFVRGSSSVPINETSGDTISYHDAIRNNTSENSPKMGFFGRLKHKLTSLVFEKQDEPERKGSTKATLGWVSLGLIVLTFLFVSSAASGILLLAGIVTGIVSLSMRKNKTEIKKKKRSNLPAIIALSLVVIGVVAVVIALSAWNAHGH